MISVNYLIREYLVWFLKVAGVDTGNIFRWRTMAASFPIVTVLISPEWGSIYRNDFCELLDTRIFGLVFEGSWCWHWKFFPLANDGSFVPHSYGVDISNSIYRNEFCELFDTIIFGLVFEVNWCWHWKYFPLENDGSFVPHSTVLITPEWGSIYRNDFCELHDTRIFGLGFEGSWCWHWKYLRMENDGSFVLQGYGVDISWNTIYRNDFCKLLDTRIFALVIEDNWCWLDKYVTVENDGSFVPQGYGVDISWNCFDSISCDDIQPTLSYSCSDEKQSSVLESDVICVEYHMTSMLSYTREVNE